MAGIFLPARNLLTVCCQGGLSYTASELTNEQGGSMNNVINWFEIPVADMDRAVAFL